MKSTSLRVVYFGMTGAFSRPPLEALLAADISVAAVVVAVPRDLWHIAPGPGDAPYRLRQPVEVRRQQRSQDTRPAMPLLSAAPAPTIRDLANERGIPLLEVLRLDDPRTWSALAALKPDAICVACFPRRLPPAVLALPRLGCLNVHPSLLPDNRGPDPLFWTFRRGDSISGVTIHRMDSGLDSGPIVLQQSLPVPEGISEATLEQRCATLGGTLLVESLHGLASGLLQPMPQNEAAATSYGWPDETEYSITPERPARWAFNFICGVSARSTPIRIHLPEATFVVRAVLGYTQNGGEMREPWNLEGDVLAVHCRPGILRVRIWPESSRE